MITVGVEHLDFPCGKSMLCWYSDGVTDFVFVIVGLMKSGCDEVVLVHSEVLLAWQIFGLSFKNCNPTAATVSSRCVLVHKISELKLWFVSIVLAFYYCYLVIFFN